MRTALQTLALLLLCLLVLTACTTSRSMASAPASAGIGTAAPTLTKQQQAIEAAPTDRVALASGHYQLLMFYSPL